MSGGWPGVTVIATGVHSSILPAALTLLISPKYPFGWHLGDCLKWKLKHDMHNPASPVVDSFYFLRWEIGNKTRQMGIEPDLIYVQVFNQLIILYILYYSIVVFICFHYLILTNQLSSCVSNVPRYSIY